MSRYELLERIGSGGMAEVYRGVAIAAGGFEKPVAIKQILPHLSEDKRFVDLLIEESRILSRLRHRGIVQIFDVGMADDGYFLVMEFVDGVDLRVMIEYLTRRGKPMPHDVAIHIIADVCEALEHAHRSRGENGEPIKLVHRDVSPSNILLSRSGEVKLTDFGIAKTIEEATGHGGVRGKFAYISPEQARNQSVDGRSDAFSAAIVLYELLLGCPLFSGLPRFDALHAVREGNIPRPREIDPSFSPQLEALVMRGLASTPADRFETAGAFANALRAYRYSLPDSSEDPARAIRELVSGALLSADHASASEEGSPTANSHPMAGQGATPRPTPGASFADDEVTHAVSILDEGTAMTIISANMFALDNEATEFGPSPSMELADDTALATIDTPAGAWEDELETVAIPRAAIPREGRPPRGAPAATSTTVTNTVPSSQARAPSQPEIPHYAPQPRPESQSPPILTTAPRFPARPTSPSQRLSDLWIRRPALVVSCLATLAGGAALTIAMSLMSDDGQDEPEAADSTAIDESVDAGPNSPIWDLFRR